MLKRLSILLFLSPLTLLAGSVDVRQETVEGMAVGTVNNNFRRLEKDKLDKRAVEKLISESTTSGSLSSLSGMKNRIINGDMRIDQRNAGAAGTVNSATAFFPVDRFSAAGQATDGVFTVAQDGSTTEPDGLRYSVKVAVTTADASIAAAQDYVFRQKLEGYNVSDMGFGESWAKQVTVSFWVYSSVVGNFPIAFRNGAADRSYVTRYAISSANTWEKKAITFTADTTGTWDITNGIGLRIDWSLGSGANLAASSEDAWVAGNYVTFSGATHLISTLNATWYITGVQLELGDTATAFEQRAFGAELALCQRYFEKTYSLGTAVGTVTTSDAVTYRPATTDMEEPITFHVNKRGAPTITFYNPSTGAAGSWRDTVAPADKNMTTISIGYWGFSWQNSNSFDGSNRVQGHWTASSEL